MKKLLLILAISASAVMADVSSQDDLLNIATAGKSTGTQFEMSKEDMQKVEGGYDYTYNFSTRQWERTNNSLTYNNNFKTYYNTSSRGVVSYNSGGTSSTLYARSYNNGSVSTWSNYNYGGYSWMAY